MEPVSLGIMIDSEGKDKMLGNHEESPGCFVGNTSHYSSQDGAKVHGFPKPKDQEDSETNDFVEEDKSITWEPYPFPNQGYYRPFYRQESFALPFVHHDYVMLRQSQNNSFENNYYPNYSFPVENRIHYMSPLKMLARSYTHETQDQEFQYFVVIDFEATCDKERNPHPQEIIEFPSVLVNSITGELEASFQTYVRPVYHQLLTDFCKDLTGIQQIQVDRGVSLGEAIFMHDRWLEDKGIKQKNFAVVTWSNWDCNVMLESECRFKRIRKPPYFNRWINLKVPFQERFRGARCNLKEAVQLAGLQWEGRAHCGLDDARNTARLLVQLMHQGIKFSITNTLMWQGTEYPTNYHSFREFLLDQNQQRHKLKELVGPPVQFRPYIDPTGKGRCTYCFCGVASSKCYIRKPGPTQGRCFFGCGNWTATRRAVCNYFAWASP